MEYRALHHFSRASLKGHYAASLRAAWLLTGLRLLYRLVPAGLAGLLFVRGGDFRKGGWYWVSFLALWGVFCFGMQLPVRCALWSRFGAWLGLCRMRTCFPHLRDYLRAVWVVGVSDILQVLAWLPAAAAGYLTGILLRESAVLPHAEWQLFGAAQAAAGCFWLSILAVRIRVSLCAVPLLCMESTDSVRQILGQSVRLLRGHHREYWCIVLCYVPGAAALLPVPFLLPSVYADLTLFLQLRLREEAQCQT